MSLTSSTEYAIVDIETTGGNASGSKMTEIAIVIHNGKCVVDRWESLINPEQGIPPAIFALTGITNEMVSDAPIFGDIAAKVYDMLQGRIFVAHNVNFDYSFIRHQLEVEGYKWTCRKLCTVRMARKIRPGLLSYSLGQLCNYLDIPISMRHRAGGDADATAILFTRLLQWDVDDVIAGMVKKTSPDQRLPPNLLPEEFDKLPEVSGVYYFHDRRGKAIYVGKALNLKKRVTSHFTGHNITPQRQHFLREIYHVSFEICGTELMALLMECIEIKRLWPAYNRSLKRFEPKFGLFSYEGQDGCLYLAIGRLSKGHTPLQVFNREYDAIKVLNGLVDTFAIERRFCRFGAAQVSRPLSEVSTKQEDGFDQQMHNAKILDAIEYLEEQQPSFYILDKGRVHGEQSCIWIQHGTFYGMGYVDELNQMVDFHDIRQSIKRYKGNYYMMQLVLDYAAKNPSKVHPFTVSKTESTYHLDQSPELLFSEEPPNETYC